MPAIQDTIHLNIVRETTVVNDTVKVVAQIAALVQTTDDAALRKEIRDTLNNLITDAQWQISNMVRTTDQTGIERLTLTATTRVSEKENSNLDGRAKTVSRPGMNVVNVHVDDAIPQAKIDTSAQDLRVALLKAAKDEVTRFNDVFGYDGQAGYRVANVSFQSGNQDASNNVRIKSSTLTSSYGSGFGDDDALGNAQKITMTASVTLARTAV